VREVGENMFSRDSGSPSRMLSRTVQTANHATVATAGTAGVCLAITTTVILINSPVDAISTLPRSMDASSIRRSSREEGSSCWCRVSAYYRDYARTNNFVQTRHPLAKPLNAAAKRVTRLKIQGHVHARKIRVQSANKNLADDPYRFNVNPLNVRQDEWAKLLSIFMFNLVVQFSSSLLFITSYRI